MAKRKPAPQKIEVINLNLSIRQIRRTSQDIQSWRNAIAMAENPDMPRRYKLYDLYADILLDGHLTSIIDKRINAVLNLPLQFVENGSVNEDITKLANSESFLFVLREILNSKFWGHSLIEFTFSPFSALLIPRKHVVQEKGWIIKEQTDTTPSYLYREPPFAYWLLEVGRPDDLGLLLKAAQYVIYKRGGFGDWAQFSELFGMPFRIGRYESYDEETRFKLEKALQESGSAAWAVIPKESDIEFISNNTNANGAVYKDLIQSCNNELSKLILGNTLTTEHQDNGARALGQVHLDAENQIHQADKKFVLNILNSKFKALLELHGYKTGNGEFVFAETEKIDLKERLSMDMQLSQIVPIDDDYWYETYHLPKPKNNPKPNPKQPVKEPTAQKKKPFFTAFSKTKIDNRFYDTVIEGKVEPIPAYDRRQVNKYAKELYAAIYKQDGIPRKQLRKLVEATGNLLSEKSFFDTFPDLESFDENELKKIITLRYNLWRFSAAKSLQQAQKYASLLRDDSGMKRPVKDFYALAEGVNRTYNTIWLRTEYNTVLNTAFVSRKYIEAQRDKDVFPYMQYKTAHDERVRSSHQKLDGVIKPVDDPFWDTYLPPNGYNCRCTVIKLSDGKTTPDTSIDFPEVPQEFRKNPVNTGEVFSENHNYFKFIDRDAINNLFPLKITEYMKHYHEYLQLSQSTKYLIKSKNYKELGFDYKQGNYIVMEKGAKPGEAERNYAMFKLTKGYNIIHLRPHNVEHIKTPDFIITKNGVKERWELKTLNNPDNVTNAIYGNIRRAVKQSENIVIEFDKKYDINEIVLGFKYARKRYFQKINTIILHYNGRERIFKVNKNVEIIFRKLYKKIGELFS